MTVVMAGEGDCRKETDVFTASGPLSHGTGHLLTRYAVTVEMMQYPLGVYFSCCPTNGRGGILSGEVRAMPFKSARQRRYMFAKHPRIARRWARHTKRQRRKKRR
jgi:hypothetical protein